MAPRAWDDGVRWHYSQTVNPTSQPLTLAFVRDDYLRLPNGGVEDDYLTSVIAVSTRQAERRTQRAHMPRTLQMVLSRFPFWGIELPLPPLIEVTSVEYVDKNGVEQTLAASAYQVSGSRDVNRRYVLAPAVGTTWPSTRAGQLDAVTITYRAGYVAGSPEMPDIPEDILHGQLMIIGELYKQRSVSVIGFGVSVNPAIVRARDLWDAFRVY